MSFFNPFRRAAPAASTSTFPGQGQSLHGSATEESEQPIKLVIKYEKDRFNIPIPKPSVTPLSTLISTLSQHTSIPRESLKLIHNGSVLKNPSLPISQFGLVDGSIVVLIGNNKPIPPAALSDSGAAKKKEKEVIPDTEPRLVGYIKGKSAFVDGMRSDIEKFEVESEGYCSAESSTTGAALGAPAPAPTPSGLPGKPTRSTVPSTTPSQPPTSSPVPTTTFPGLQKDHARLSELLLQGLLKLDNITIPSEWKEARAVRKEGVRTVQKELDRVDEAWRKVKEVKR